MDIITEECFTCCMLQTRSRILIYHIYLDFRACIRVNNLHTDSPSEDSPAEAQSGSCHSVDQDVLSNTFWSR